MSDHDQPAGNPTPCPAVAPKAALSWRKRAVFTVVVFLGLLLFAEATLQVAYRATVGRWLWQWWAIPIYAPDPIRGYKLKPNLDYWHKTREFAAHYLTDANGMRTLAGQPPAVVPKPEDVFRIIAFGPSFTFGWGVNYEDSYMHRIAAGLRVPGKRVELLNLGTPSQPTSCQLKWLRETGYVYQPDLIIQTAYADIDRLETDDTLPANIPTVLDGYLYTVKNPSRWLWLKSPQRYSALVHYSWNFYYVLRNQRPASSDGREFYKPATLTATNAADDCVKLYQDYLHFVQQAARTNVPVVFIHVPLAWVVRPADVSRVAHKNSQPLDPFAARERTTRLSGALTSHRINFINPLPALLRQDRETRMYNLYDIHFTVAGNKVVADEALPVIQTLITPGAPAPR